MGKERYPGKVDDYPKKDIYIPEAEIEADKLIKDRKSQEWSNAFIAAMNTILSERGLRVL